MSRITQLTTTTIDWLFADFESRTDKWSRTSSLGTLSFPAVSGYGDVMRIVSPGSGDVEIHRTFTPSYGSNCFKGFTSIDLDIDLHGATILGGDASAFGFDQGGWKYISLSDYVTNGLDGFQSISIPIADLVTAGLDVDALASFLIIRFWHTDIITVDIDNITFKNKANSSFSQPDLPDKKTTKSTWKLQSVDTMKWSKDTMRGQKTESEILSLVKKDKKLGLTHMTVDCPYDDYSDYDPVIESGYKEKWLNNIRANNMNVWHRQHFNEWEGDYDFQKITPRTTPSRALGDAAGVLAGTDTSSWLYLHYNYIKTHSSEFVAGDIFSPIAEIENAGYAGATTDQFSDAMELWEFIRDLITVCNRAFADIGLEDEIYIGFFGHSGYTVMNKIDEFTVDCEKFLSIDHYVFDDTTMSSDLDTIIDYFDVPLHIGEWGNYQDSDETTNATLVTTIYNVFSGKTDIFGVSYWDDIGGSYESLLNSDLTEKENYYAVQNFFGGDAVFSISGVKSEPTKIKKIQLKEQVLFPTNLHDIRTGLKVDYDYTETGNIVIDQSGNGNNGTIVGATRVSGYGDLSGRKGDGVDDRITFGTVGIFDGTKEFSILNLFKLNSIPTAQARLINFQKERAMLLTFGDNVDNDVLHIRINQGGWRNSVETGALVADKWYLITVTYNPTTGWKMYEWFNLIDTDTTIGDISTDYAFANAILADSNGGNPLPADVCITKFFNEELSADQVRNLDLFIKKIAGKI